MPAALIDGKAIAAQVRADLSAGVAAFREAHGRPPGLRVVLVGDDPASASYVRAKAAAAAEVGIDAKTLRYGADLSEADLLAVVDRLNQDDTVDGILVQLPLPTHMDSGKVIEALDPDKDIDGFHPENAGRVMLGRGGFAPCTPAGIVEMLQRSGVATSGSHAVIIGRSHIVGTPLANLLIQKGIDATVTICHSRTPDLGTLTRQADIVIAAVGRPNTVTAEMVRPGATVIDVGVNRVDDPSRERGYRLVGDVDFEGVREVAAHITPVPGGVGPMTIAMLLKNTLAAAEARARQ